MTINTSSRHRDKFRQRATYVNIYLKSHTHSTRHRHDKNSMNQMLIWPLFKFNYMHNLYLFCECDGGGVVVADLAYRSPYTGLTCACVSSITSFRYDML